MIFEVLLSKAYENWFACLRDVQSRARINARIRRLSLGNMGDVRPIGSGVSELRINFGPGYRIYFVMTNVATVVLLIGGDKGTQTQDIRRAIKMAKNL